MNTLIVYIDDVDYALQLLQPKLEADARPPTQWLLVGCAPRVTFHVSKWLTRSSRENWRGRWADKTFARLVPPLSRTGDQVLTQLSEPDLVEQTRLLVAQYGQAQVIDARRPKLDHSVAPAEPAPPPSGVLGIMATLAGASWSAAIVD